MRNRGKNRQRRGLPPPCGIHPAVLGGGCAFLFSALGLVGSHRRRGNSTGSICSSDKYYFYYQGLTLVSRCSQQSAARLPAAGTPLGRGRPGCENHQAVGPAAKLAWCGGRNRSHSKGNGPNIDMMQVQPHTPGRFLGGNALSGFWCLLPAQKAPPAERVSPRQGNKNTPEKSLRHTKKSQHRPQWSVLALLNVLTDFPGAHSPAWGTPPCRRDG